jgi:hypothetical protein
MSRNKKNLVARAGAVNTIAKTPIDFIPNFNNLTTKSKSKDPSKLILDLIVATSGTVALKNILTNVLTNVTKSAEFDVKNIFKEIISDEIASNNSSAASQINGNGLNVPASFFDNEGSLKYNPNDLNECQKKLLLSTSNNNDNKLFNSLSSPQNINNLSFEFNQSQQSFNIRSITNETPLDLLNSFTDNSSFVDVKLIISKTINNIFGLSFLNQKKSLNEIEEELKYKTYIRRFIDNDEEDDPFVLSEEDLKFIERKARLIKLGVDEIDVGCAIIESTIDEDVLCGDIDSINNASRERDFDNFLENMYQNLASNSDMPDDADANTARNNFFRKMLEEFKLAFITSILNSASGKTLLMLIDFFKTGKLPNNLKITDYIKQYRELIKCLVKKLLAILTRELFNYLKSVILPLVSAAAARIAAEKLKIYTSQLKSLRGARTRGSG